jgi:hypothetical protein
MTSPLGYLQRADANKRPKWSVLVWMGQALDLIWVAVWQTWLVRAVVRPILSVGEHFFPPVPRAVLKEHGAPMGGFGN